LIGQARFRRLILLTIWSRCEKLFAFGFNGLFPSVSLVQENREHLLGRDEAIKGFDSSEELPTLKVLLKINPDCDRDNFGVLGTSGFAEGDFLELLLKLEFGEPELSLRKSGMSSRRLKNKSILDREP